MPDFELVSNLAAPWEAVWEHVRFLDSLNREMLPVFCMSGPGDDLLELAQTKGFGETLFTSAVLLGGWLPVERMQVTLSAGGVDETQGWFVEASPMRLMRHWRHERRVERLQAGCRLSDRLDFSLRLPALNPAARPLLAAFFAHRHRQLGRLFGLLADPRRPA